MRRHPPLLHVHPTVDVDLGACDIGTLGDEEARDGSDFPGLAEAAHRDLRQQDFLDLVGQVQDHVRLDETGAEGVDLDVEARELLGGGLREADDAGFGRGVVRLAEVAHLADDRGHVDDAAAAALDQVRQGGVGAVKDAAEVGGDDLLPLLDGHTPNRPIAVDAGVVNEDVEATVLLDRRLHERRALIGVGDVGEDGQRGAALLNNLTDDFLGGLLTLVVVDDDLCAVLGEL